MIVLCILPSFIMSIQEALMERHKQYSCYNFILRVFQGFASNFGGNFLSRGVAKSHQMTIFFYFINGIIIWICFRASIIAGLSQKNLKLPFTDLGANHLLHGSRYPSEHKQNFFIP